MSSHIVPSVYEIRPPRFFMSDATVVFFGLKKKMNTFLWGPPLWRLLHTIAHAPTARFVPQQIDLFFTTLRDLLPCRFCRESYGPYLDSLGPPSHAIAQQRFPQFLYDLHQQVNKKLKRTNACPTIKHVFMRFAVHPQAWSLDDVCDIIAYFGLNYTREKRSVYYTWWRMLPVMVGLTDPMLQRVLQNIECPASKHEFVSVAITLAGVPDEYVGSRSAAYYAAIV